MVKVINFWKRRPGTDLDAFREDWLQFGELVRDVPGVARYVHNLTLPAAYRQGEPFADGVSELTVTHDDLACVATAPESIASRAFAEGFLDIERGLGFIANDRVLKEGPVTSSGVKAFTLAIPRTDMREDEFRDYWTRVHGPLTSSLPSVHRYIQSHSRSMLPGPDGRIIAGCSVTWHDSVDAMRAGVQTPEWAALAADEPNFIHAHPPLLITREQVIVGEQ